MLIKKRRLWETENILNRKINKKLLPQRLLIKKTLNFLEEEVSGPAEVWKLKKLL
jgi:hypothetical protein